MYFCAIIIFLSSSCGIVDRMLAGLDSTCQVSFPRHTVSGVNKMFDTRAVTGLLAFVVPIVCLIGQIGCGWDCCTIITLVPIRSLFNSMHSR